MTSEDDIIKILVSSDNHVGFLERDPIRGEDSFLAFEEVLGLAIANDVDMVLLAGDLFHENKPSRYTLWRCAAFPPPPAALRARRLFYPPPRFPPPTPTPSSRAAPWRSCAST
jgi:hypothetical protein